MLIIILNWMIVVWNRSSSSSFSLSFFFELDLSINKQDSIQVYLQACRDYQIHPFNQVIEGFETNILDLSEMSINDLDLKAICLALRVDKNEEKLKSVASFISSTMNIDSRENQMYSIDK